MFKYTVICIIILVTMFIYLKYNDTLIRIPYRRKSSKNPTLTIYRTGKSRYISSYIHQGAYEDWFKFDNNIEMIWYNDEDCEKFMSSQSKEIYDVYNTLKPKAFKCDLFRLCLLYERGGMYIDDQAQPFVSIEEMFRDTNNASFISIRDHRLSQYGIHNGLIYVNRKNHPFLKAAIDRIVKTVKGKRYDDHVLSVTGPISLKRAINKYLGRNINDNFKIGFNDFGENSIYLFSLEFGPKQCIVKNNEYILCKKTSIIYYILQKINYNTNYIRMYNNRDIYISPVNN